MIKDEIYFGFNCYCIVTCACVSWKIQYKLMSFKKHITISELHASGKPLDGAKG